MAEDGRYAIGDLADLAGVSRRTVRYYVQEGLLPAPLGLGRGKHYDDRHLERLLWIRGLQEDGHALDEIRTILEAGGNATAAAPGEAPTDQDFSLTSQAIEDSPRAARTRHRRARPGATRERIRQEELFVLAGRAAAAAKPSRSAWTRLELAPGIELQVSSDHRLPPPSKIRELTEWCRREFRIRESEEER